MRRYCVKCYTTHDEDVPCFDTSAQAAKDMGIDTTERSSPEQARRDDAVISRAVILVVLAALLLIVGGAFLFS
jgi:hypothetical protein